MKQLFSLFLLFFCWNVDGLSFMSIGDWGGAYFGDYHLRNAQATSAAMAKWSAENNASFVLNTGDNFYYCGITNETDPQIIRDYTVVYSNINMPWYNSLGNHDYGFNPEAQLDLDKYLPNWIMDDRYYHRRIEYSPNQYINIIVLDTNPCVNDYRGTDKRKWNPCSPEYPTCGPIPGVCKFHENIIAQECEPQRAWFANTVNKINADEWIIVIGHHRADEIDNADFQLILDSPKINLYINGHVHALEHYKLNDQSKYITSGAGCMVFGPHITHGERRGSNIWSKTKTGFTGHILSTAPNGNLTSYFMDIHGTILHQFSVTLPKSS